MMIQGLTGSEAAEKVLLFMANYESGYAREIAVCFNLSVSQVQKQLQKFERDSILVSRLVGKARVYEWNPRYLLLTELKNLLKKVLANLPDVVLKKHFRERVR